MTSAETSGAAQAGRLDRADQDHARGGETGRGDARHGDARHGDARHGDARHGDARHGDARHGDARHGDVRRGDVALVVALGAMALITINAAWALGAPRWIVFPGWLASTALLSVTLAPVATRRRFPASSLAVCTVGLILVRVFYVPESWATSIALFLTFQAAGRWAGDRVRSPVRAGSTLVLLIVLARMVAVQRQHFTLDVGDEVAYYVNSAASVALNLAFLGAAWWLGEVDRARADRERELSARTRELEAEREQNTRRAVLSERLRIAREVHDVVAHHVSVMGIQAGAARRLLGSGRPEAVEEPLRSIESSSRSAVTELQRLLLFLRSGDASAPTPGQAAAGNGSTRHAAAAGSSPPGSESELTGRPVGGHAEGRQRAATGVDPRAGAVSKGLAGRGAIEDRQPVPGLAQLPALRRHLADAGLACSYEQTGAERELPPAVDLSAYRIIQESLTNVLKHARVDRATLRLAYGADALSIEVTNEQRAGAGAGPAGGSVPAGTGTGIRGMKERAALVGGSLTAAASSGGEFRVVARLPYLSRVPA